MHQLRLGREYLADLWGWDRLTTPEKVDLLAFDRIRHEQDKGAKEAKKANTSEDSADRRALFEARRKAYLEAHPNE